MRGSGSSYVTKTIKIFDRDSSTMSPAAATVGQLGNGDKEIDKDKRLKHNKSNQTGKQNARNGKGSIDKHPRLSKVTHEIDWEQVFHQLRK